MVVWLVHGTIIRKDDPRNAIENLVPVVYKMELSKEVTAEKSEDSVKPPNEGAEPTNMCITRNEAEVNTLEDRFDSNNVSVKNKVKDDMDIKQTMR